MLWRPDKPSVKQGFPAAASADSVCPDGEQHPGNDHAWGAVISFCINPSRDVIRLKYLTFPLVFPLFYFPCGTIWKENVINKFPLGNKCYLDCHLNLVRVI